MKMKIIDFVRKGNQVKFLLGDKDLKDWHGDDWDDAPYNDNAGTVYEEFIKGEKVFVFDFDDAVLEPYCGDWNSRYTKDMMKNRLIPCIVVLNKSIAEKEYGYWGNSDDIPFRNYSGADNPLIQKFFFGDIIEVEEI